MSYHYIKKGGRKFLSYCSHSDLDSDKERDSDESTDDSGDEGTKECAYDEGVEDAREETREIEIPPDSPTANTGVSGPSQMSEVVDMAPLVRVDEAIFDTRECQNSISVRFIP